MVNTAVVVFTARSAERIVAEGGSQAWVLNRGRARRCDYLVCTQNTHSNWGDGHEPHGSAFLVGKLDDVVPSAEDKDRWVIRISEYARVSLPDKWDGGRNPVRYTTLDELDIDPSKLTFTPVPQSSSASAGEKGATAAASSDSSGDDEVTHLTIADAKRGLAAAFGVPVEAIEITIRA